MSGCALLTAARVLLALGLFLPVLAAADQAVTLFHPVDPNPPISAPPTDPYVVLRERLVSIAGIAPTTSRVTLNLFDDVELLAYRSGVEVATSDGFAWFGTIDDVASDLGRSVSLVVENQRLAGSVILDQVVYLIRPLDDGLHVIWELDPIAVQSLPSPTAARWWADEAASRSSTDSLADAVHALVNRERVTRGLTALRPDMRLNRAAQLHSQDMASNRYFSHTGQDGSSAGQRIAAQGYSFSTWGENIAYGYSTADAVMNQWMNSPGHRSNILKDRFCDLGVGIADNGNGRIYWTQDFGRQRGEDQCRSMPAPTPPLATEAPEPQSPRPAGPPPQDSPIDPPPPTPATPATAPVPTSEPPAEPIADGLRLGNDTLRRLRLGAGEHASFEIDIPVGTRRLWVITSGWGNVDLYLKQAVIDWPQDQGPHTEAGFVAPFKPGSYERVVIASPAAGVWRLRVDARSPSGVLLQILWR